MATLDIVGYLVVNPTGSVVADGDASASVPPLISSSATKGIYLPLVTGSSYREGPALTPTPAAVGLIEPINFSVGAVQPVLQVRTYAMNDWFTPANLQLLLGLGNVSDPVVTSNGYRDNTTGLMHNSIGSVIFKFAGETPVQFPRAKVDNFSLTWGMGGGTIDVSMTLYPYGLPRRERFTAPRSIDTALLKYDDSGGGGTEASSSNVAGWPNLSLYGAANSVSHGGGLPWQSQGVEYAGTLLDGVFGGTIGFNNGLTPDMTTPSILDDTHGSIACNQGRNGRIYPKDYWNNMLNYTLELTQLTDATVADTDWSVTGATAPLPWVQAGQQIKFNSPDEAANVSFYFSVLSPDHERTMRMGVAQTRRMYRNMRNSNATPSAYIGP